MPSPKLPCGCLIDEYVDVKEKVTLKDENGKESVLTQIKKNPDGSHVKEHIVGPGIQMGAFAYCGEHRQMSKYVAARSKVTFVPGHWELRKDIAPPQGS